MTTQSPATHPETVARWNERAAARAAAEQRAAKRLARQIAKSRRLEAEESARLAAEPLMTPAEIVSLLEGC